MLVNVGLGNVQTLLLMSGKSGLHLIATVAGLATQVGLGFAIIPAHGVLGAAYAWAAGIVVENVIAAVAARRIIGQPIISGRLAMVGGAVAAVTVASGSVAVLVAGRTVPGLALAVGLLIVFCGAALAYRPTRAAVRSAVSAFRQAPEAAGALRGMREQPGSA
jgi:O-antigen/teichoic acid export membrane protein